MKGLPEIENFVINRPGYFGGTSQHLISNPSSNIFWEDFYSEFHSKFKLTEPLENFANKINPHFGYFGYRWHPINFQPNYFHIGIDIADKIGQPIKTVYKGLLDYSGFANVNGNYVVVKHPDIKTIDGFVFQSIYMHCKDYIVRFNPCQKVLREFVSKSFSISNEPILTEQNIATIGDTGNILGVVPHLHLQFEFVKGKKHIVIDPLKLHNKPSFTNLTATISSESDFKLYYQEHSRELSPWKKFWATKI